MKARCKQCGAEIGNDFIEVVTHNDREPTPTLYLCNPKCVFEYALGFAKFCIEEGRKDKPN